MNVRRLAPGDEDVVAALATREPHTALLREPNTLFLVAFDDGEPIGFVLAYELRRRHGDPSTLFVYEVDVHADHRRRGVATALLRRLESEAVARGIPHGFVLTDRANVAAMRLYESVGGRIEGEDVVWEFRYADR